MAMGEKNKCHATDEEGRRSIVTLTKKRFSALEQRLRDWTQKQGHDEEYLSSLKNIICDTLAFNPNVPAYTKEADVRRKQGLYKTMQENNMNTYEVYGKAYYEANKEACLQRTAKYKASKQSAVPVL